MRVLVTGGAGFIGSHIVDALVARGDDVVILDSLEPQVHPDGVPPDWLPGTAELIHGSIADAAAVERALAGCDAVLHQAALVGTAQSQYQPARYVAGNVLGTARLLEGIIAHRDHLRRVVVASSMASYGEGAALCESCGPTDVRERGDAELAAGAWEPHCPSCGAALTSVATPETWRRRPQNVYALTKAQTEDLALLTGRTYGVPTTALRYFNVYGPRQSLSNPYTGVVAIFLSRLRNGHAPVVYEDGHQTRDFVSVHDIVRANLLALDADAGAVGDHIFNVGSGSPISILDVACSLAEATGVAIEPDVTGTARRGDTRHCTANADAIEEVLGWRPAMAFGAGVREVIEWSAQVVAVDRFDAARAELEERGLV